MPYTVSGCSKMNYIELFKKSAEVNRDKKALIASDTSLTYGELDELSGKVAGKLRAMGISGGFAAVLMGRRAEYIAAYIGVLKADCAVVPVVPEYPRERIDFITENCEAAVTVTEDFFMT